MYRSFKKKISSILKMNIYQRSRFLLKKNRNKGILKFFNKPKIPLNNFYIRNYSYYENF